MELYIHIPFCKRKCEYCDFLSFPAGDELKEQYVRELIREISEWEDRGDVIVSSVFVGGGTPSLLSGNQIFRIMKSLFDNYQFAENAEISIEANPGTLDREKLDLYKKAGINRLSIGLQSALNEELKLLGRIHTWEEFLESYEAARTAGFENINVDLMSALPGQKVEGWIATLEKVIALKPEHISAYGLIIEAGTPFYDQYADELKKQENGEICMLLPSEEEERDMYRKTKEILEKHGYFRYEISNYAQKGKECRHNCGYWLRKEYKGFGLGAASLLKEVRFFNTADMKEYLLGNWLDNYKEVLDRKAQIEETMFLGLRMIQGVSEEAFATRYGEAITDVYGKLLESMYKKGLMVKKGKDICLTEQGIDISNYVLSHFLLD